jgi:outer membrane protein TolC
VTPFGTVVSQLFAHDYPTWAVGVSISYPIGESSEQAAYARSKLEYAQSQERLKGSEARAIQQVRDAAWKIEMNAKRIETTRAARELAEQRLDAERKRFEVGMSTSFLVIQAQRDLAQAKNNELGSVLAYDLSLVDFEALQEAGPPGQSSGGGSSSSAPAAAASGGSAPNPAAAAPPAGALSPTASVFGRQ